MLAQKVPISGHFNSGQRQLVTLTIPHTTVSMWLQQHWTEACKRPPLVSNTWQIQPQEWANDLQSCSAKPRECVRWQRHSTILIPHLWMSHGGKNCVMAKGPDLDTTLLRLLPYDSGQGLRKPHSPELKMDIFKHWMRGCKWSFGLSACRIENTKLLVITLIVIVTTLILLLSLVSIYCFSFPLLLLLYHYHF